MKSLTNMLTALSRAGQVAWKDLLVQFQSPILVVFVVIMPLAMILITGLAFKGFEPRPIKAVVAVVVPGDPARAQAVADELRHAPEMAALKADKKQPGGLGVRVDFEAEGQLTEEEARARLMPQAPAANKLSGVLFYPRDEGPVRLLVGEEQSVEHFAVVSTVDRVLGKTDLRKKAGDGEAGVGWTVEAVSGPASAGAGFTSFSQAVAGNGVMFILLNCVMSGAFGLIKERRQHTLDRLLIAPLSRGTILSGKILGVYLLGVMQAVVIFGFGGVILVPMGNLLGVALVTLVFILVGCSLGLMISALARREEMVQVLGGPVGLVMTALGGGMFPVDQGPRWMQWVALLFPTGWAMNAYQELMWHGASVAAVWLNLLVLAGFSAVFFVIGTRSLHWE